MRSRSKRSVPAIADQETEALDRMIEFACEQAKSIGLATTSDLLVLARKSVHDSRSKRTSDGNAVLDDAMCSRGLH